MEMVYRQKRDAFMKKKQFRDKKKRNDVIERN